MTNEPEGLTPCPFCGDAMVYCAIVEGQGKYAIGCESCGATGPSDETAPASAWNRRAGHSPDTGKMVPPNLNKADDLAKLIREKFVGVAWGDMDYVLEDEDWQLILAGLGHMSEREKAEQTELPADLVDAISATLRRVGPVEGGGYREQARAVLALFAEREKAAGDLLLAASGCVDGPWTLRQFGEALRRLGEAIGAAKAAGLGARHD